MEHCVSQQYRERAWILTHERLLNILLIMEVAVFLLIYLILFILFLAALGLRCCAQAFSSCSEQGLLVVAVHGLLIGWLLLLQSTGSRRVGFSSCGSRAIERSLSSCGPRAWFLRGMWDLPGPGLKPVSPALAGGFLTTVPPGKPRKLLFLKIKGVLEAKLRMPVYGNTTISLDYGRTLLDSVTLIFVF